MTLSKRSKTLAAGLAAAASGALVLAALTAGAGTGLASPATLTLQHDCKFPIIGTKRMSTEITTTELPSSIAVGEPTPEFDIAATSTLPADVTEGAKLVGAVSIEGTAKAKAAVDAPQGNIEVTVPNTVPKTDIPGSGALVVKATGSAPSLTFSKAGEAKIIVGDFALEMILRDKDGKPITLSEEKVWPCKLVDGQNNVLHKFTITGDGGEEAGGAEAGGEEAGGEEAGGAEAGGVEAGGEEAGGAEAGGVEAGGEEAGGAEAAGEEVGGVEAGGAEAGGEDLGGEVGGVDAGGEDFGGAEADAEAGGADFGGGSSAGGWNDTSSGGLALTGASVLVPTGVGVVLIGLGTLLVLLRRRSTT